MAVVNCLFLNNSAQSGGAIGSTSSSLDISSSSFQNNTAICPRINVSCSAWAGAISANEALSLTLNGNHFSHNSVNLQSLAVTDANSQAAGGGGCVSVLYHYDVDGSRIFIVGNVFQSCSVQMYGLSVTGKPPRPFGVQYGNAYGGAVSLYYGLRAASSLQVQNAIFVAVAELQQV
jgi:predicted outer membrane repeat protein